MSPKTRLFMILWAAGIAGVLTLLLVDLQAMIAAFPVPEGTPPPELPPPALLKIAAIAQPAVLVSIAVLIGIGLAPKVGLRAPAAEALAYGRSIFPELQPQIIPGLIAGVACGLMIVATWVIAKPFLSAEFISRAEGFNRLIPNAMRVLYGGFTEEILLRWGLMTFLVWIQWAVFQRSHGIPRGIIFLAAIIVSAVLFGIGHLPVAYALAGELTTPVVIYVITANSVFGIVAGFLYWRRGLESAMLAHIVAHIVLIFAIDAGV